MPQFNKKVTSNGVPYNKIATAKSLKNRKPRPNPIRPSTSTSSMIERPIIHPDTKFLCYLSIIHPMYYDMAYSVLGPNPFWFQVQSFVKQLVDQDCHPEQLELLAIERLDLQVQGFQCHLSRGSTPFQKLSFYDLENILTPLSLVGYEYQTRLPDPTFFEVLVDFVRKFSIQELYMLPVLILTVKFQLQRCKKRFWWRNNIATTCLVPLLIRLCLTGHMFTTVDPEPTAKFEFTWLLCKITFLIMVIPRPSGFRWLLPSVIFWNNFLQTLALFFGYKYFCSMLDANIPLARIPKEHYEATPEDLVALEQFKAAWQLLYKLFLENLQE